MLTLVFVANDTPPPFKCLFGSRTIDVITLCTHHPVMDTHTSPTVIAFASPKGGVGKSTSCLAIAGALAALNTQVHIVDFDQTETLYRWSVQHAATRSIPNLTVEKGPAQLTGEYLKELWNKRSGYVLLDLAGSLTNQMISLTAFAALTITPATLNEPDIVEADKLNDQLIAMGRRINKPICHRVLLNGVPPILAGYQTEMLRQLEASGLTRFDQIMHTRAAYPESFLTGVPPHFADRGRPPVKKAVDEIDALLLEVFSAIEQQKAAA